MNKPKLIKDFDKLDEALKSQVLLTYPKGFKKHLIVFKNHKNELITALPFETADRYYMLKMNKQQQKNLVSQEEVDEENEKLDNDFLEIMKEGKDSSDEDVGEASSDEETDGNDDVYD